MPKLMLITLKHHQLCYSLVGARTDIFTINAGIPISGVPAIALHIAL